MSIGFDVHRRNSRWLPTALSLVALADDHLLAGLAMFFPDHDRIIAAITLLDDGGALFVARALAHGHASANRADAHADTGLFSTRNTRGQDNTSRG
jgi:hypothetical protein